MNMSLLPKQLNIDYKFCCNVSYNNLVGVIPTSNNFSSISPDRLDPSLLYIVSVASIFQLYVV